VSNGFWAFVFILFTTGVQLQKLASEHGDLRVYDVIHDAKQKLTAKKSKTRSTKKKNKSK